MPGPARDARPVRHLVNSLASRMGRLNDVPLMNAHSGKARKGLLSFNMVENECNGKRFSKKLAVFLAAATGTVRSCLFQTTSDQ